MHIDSKTEQLFGPYNQPPVQKTFGLISLDFIKPGRAVFVSDFVRPGRAVLVSVFPRPGRAVLISDFPRKNPILRGDDNFSFSSIYQIISIVATFSDL